jgi:hypothetical protein
MILDQTNLFSDAQAITATAGSTNTIDLGPIKTGLTRDIGKGKAIPLLIQVVTVFDSTADDETLTISLEQDSTDTITPDRTDVLAVISNADLKTLGYKVPVQAMIDGVRYRYIRLKYTVTGTGNFTAGAITAGITMGRQTNG